MLPIKLTTSSFPHVGGGGWATIRSTGGRCFSHPLARLHRTQATRQTRHKALTPYLERERDGSEASARRSSGLPPRGKPTGTSKSSRSTSRKCPACQKTELGNYPTRTRRCMGCAVSPFCCNSLHTEMTAPASSSGLLRLRRYPSSSTAAVSITGTNTRPRTQQATALQRLHNYLGHGPRTVRLSLITHTLRTCNQHRRYQQACIF